MTTLLPVAVAIAASGLPPPSRPVIFQRGERFLLVWTQLEHWPISGRRLAQRRRPSTFSITSVVRARERGQRVPAWALSLPLTATLVAAAGLAGCSGSAGFASSGRMREIWFLSG